MQIDVWTDGSAAPNPGRGGWAAILESNGHRREISGAMVGTVTSNQAELQAVIEAFDAIHGKHEVTINTDSRYVQLAIVGMGKPLKNLDMLRRIDTLADRHNVQVRWVKAHSGDVNNERCDTIAKQAASNHT